MTLTLKNAFEIIRGELAQVNVPAEQMLTNGIHVGRAYQVATEVLDAIIREEQAQQEQTAQGEPVLEPVMELVPEEEVPEEVRERAETPEGEDTEKG